MSGVCQVGLLFGSDQVYVWHNVHHYSSRPWLL